MAGDLLSKFKVLLPGRTKPKGTVHTPTYDPENSSQVIGLPDYKEHLQDLITTRQSESSQELIAQLVKSDPDASSALNAYLTVANVEPFILVTDTDGAIDREGHKMVNQILEALTSRRDYSKGFLHKKSVRALSEDFRYMLLARGGIGAEAIFDEMLLLSEIRHVDMATIRWQEKSPGVLVPYQDQGGGDPIKIDIPTFFVAYYRKPPMEAYGHSPFVSAINTMAARQQIINDLYRLMQVTGFPRIDIKVLEEVLRKNAPADVRADEAKFRIYLRDRRREISGQFAAIRVDQPLVHTDSTELKILNEKNPAAGLNVQSVIDVLNAQNQAGLRTMATILGRGESGVNTATVEAQLFAMNASSLNEPTGELLSSILTLAIRLNGSESKVTVKFPKVELRSDLEQEPHLQLRGNRLRQDLSDGLITDDEYHLQMYRRIRPDAVGELSGTGFVSAKMEVDAEKVTPNSDPLGRSVSRASNKQVKSNQNKIKN